MRLCPGLGATAGGLWPPALISRRSWWQRQRCRTPEWLMSEVLVLRWRRSGSPACRVSVLQAQRAGGAPAAAAPPPLPCRPSQQQAASASTPPLCTLPPPVQAGSLRIHTLQNRMRAMIKYQLNDWYRSSPDRKRPCHVGHYLFCWDKHSPISAA